MYRMRHSLQAKSLEVLLVHFGGPFWAKKDLGAWSIPKGEYLAEEDPLAAARREFHEETGFPAEGEFRALGEIRQAGGKSVLAWAFRGDCDPTKLKSNNFRMEWPPGSGHQIEAPEVDRAAWFSLPAARERMLRGQLPLLDRLVQLLGAGES